MSKNLLWNWIKSFFDDADNKELGIAWSWFGYKKNGDLIELNYKEKGFSFETLLFYLKELDKEGLIDMVDTRNMGFIISKK